MISRMLTGVGVASALLVGAWALGLPSTGLDPQTGSGRAEVAVQRVEVTAVVDGDTLRVATPRGKDLGRVRLLGINAPEISHGRDGAECYGETATGVLRNLTPVGTTVTLRSDPTQADRDVYGRLLRYVETRDFELDVDEELLRRGAVRVYDSRRAVARAERYRRASDDAQHNGRGLWLRC